MFHGLNIERALLTANSGLKIGGGPGRLEKRQTGNEVKEEN